jgi:hypothetical protein
MGHRCIRKPAPKPEKMNHRGEFRPGGAVACEAMTREETLRRIAGARPLPGNRSDLGLPRQH